MFLNRHIVKRYRALSIASLIAGGSLLPLLPALADQNSPTPNTPITNQATAQFTDAADSSTQNIVSNIVSVTLAEVAGISAIGDSAQGIGATPIYRTNTVYFDFKIFNTGNDPTQIFIPGKPSSATITTGSGTPVAIVAADIGQIQVTEYGTIAPGASTFTVTAVNKDNLVNTTTGSATGNLAVTTGGTTAIPNTGSVPAGGYIKVRIPVKVPFDALSADVIRVTLGNTVGQPGNTTSTDLDNSNVPYVAGGNDLYTQDNADNLSGETVGAPVNGDGPPGDNNATLHRQEASATQQATVVDPAAYTISGTVWDDRNKSGTATFTNIFNTGEFGTNAVFGTNATPINVILVNETTGFVIANKTLAATDNGTYSFPGIQAITDVRIFLSDTAGVVGSAPPNAPTTPVGATTISSLGWAGTSPLTTATFRTGLANRPNSDFGIIQKPKLLLVKRITGMKKSTDLATDPMRRINPNDGKVLNAYVNETNNPDDNSPMNWPTPVATNLIGAVDGGKVSPGDTIEYTIYFLNNQGADATNVKLCDPILSSQTFNNNGYGTGKDMQLQIGTDTAIDLTAVNNTAVDRAYAYTAGNAPAVGTCNIPTANQGSPGVEIDLTGAAGTNQLALTAIPGAISPGTASATSTSGTANATLPNTTFPYGLFRFTTKVNP
jgi:uncharacterized repeat protein (TIGR01451 family)